MGLITLDLKAACQEPGCPICRLRYKSEQRYITNLLWENVTDGGIRALLVRSLGFCAVHAWQLQETEQTQWNDGLGTGIIYEDLTERALAGIKALAKETKRPSLYSVGSRWRRRLRRVLRQWSLKDRLSGATSDDFLPSGMIPRGSCRVCELGDSTETTFLSWLIQGLVTDELGEDFAASDGLCLPHLRRALILAHEEEPDAAPLLLQVAEEKTRQLTRALGEYVRKHNWQFHHETMQPEEQSSWQRAVAFFAGEKRPQMGDGQVPALPFRERDHEDGPKPDTL